MGTPKLSLSHFYSEKKLLILTLITALVFSTAVKGRAKETTAPANGSGAASQKPVVMETDLETCIETALKNNRRRPASRLAVEIAEARHRQALAAYWPQITAQGGYQVRDEAPNFIFPGRDITLPMGGTLPISIPGVGTIPTNSISIPDQDVKLMDKETFNASIQGTLLLFDGGMRKGYREQAKGYVDLMKEESRRTDLEIIDSVKRLYYGSILAANLDKLGHDTLERMQATLDLTETMYKEGSGRVKKTDWLENKIMVESIRATVAQLEKNKETAQAALANTMGMAWDDSVVPTDKAIPFAPFKGNLDHLVSTAYQFNPDWGKVQAGIEAAQGGVRTARSGYFPKIALTGELNKYWNDYDGGLATDTNLKGWNVEIGVKIPLFNGFMTKNKLAEAKAKLAKIKEEQFLLNEGIGLMIRDAFIGLKASEKSREATLSAMKAGAENRDLNTRAYQYELVETEKVIRAQLMESLMSAQHYKAGYDHAALQSKLDLMVGTEVLNQLREQ